MKSKAHQRTDEIIAEFYAKRANVSRVDLLNEMVALYIAAASFESLLRDDSTRRNATTELAALDALIAKLRAASDTRANTKRNGGNHA